MLESPATDPGRAAEENEMRAGIIAALNAAFRGFSFPGGRWSTGYGAEMAADALLSGPLAPILQEAAQLRARLHEAEKGEARAGSEYADAMDARMEDAAHMETLRVAVLVLAECKIGSGLAAVREWFADGMRGPIQWPEGTLFAAWAAEHDIYDCNGAMGFRRRDRGRAV